MIYPQILTQDFVAQQLDNMFKKIIPAIFSFLFIVQPALAQHTDVYTLDDFSAMLQSHISPYLLPKNAASEARNVRSNNQFGSLSKRPSTMNYGSLGVDFAITSLHRFYKSDNTAYLIGTRSTFIMLGDDDGGTAITLRDQLTTGLRWTWVTYDDKAIGCNGTDRCQKYDGATVTTSNTDEARSTGILTTDLGAPFAELNTGSNLDASSWYQYKVQFTDGTTTWYSEAVSNPLLTGSTVRDIRLEDIPLGPSGTTSRTLYRTEGQASRASLSTADFKVLATLSDNVTVAYNDSIADASLGATWSTTGKTTLTPPIVKYITIHKERLFGGNAPNLNSYIYWSYAFKPDIFDPLDYDFVRIDDGDPITFIIPITGKLAIGKTNSITNFETQSSDDTKWQFYTFSFIGCPAPFSAAISPIGIIYLGWNGIYVYNGESSQLISDVVTDVIRDVLSSNFENASGVYFNNEYRLAYTSESLGASDNDSVLVLDTVRNSYVIDDEDVNAWTIFNSGNDFGTLYSGSSGTDGKVLSHNPALSTIVLRYKSDLDAGTKDSILIAGTDNEPEISLGWGITINDSSLAGVTINSASATATIDHDDTTGYWWSPAIQVNASNYDKLYWNEDLGCCGDITFAIRSATVDSITLGSIAWSSEFTLPSGSDVSGLTANSYLQFRTKLTTTDITATPIVKSLNNYVIKMIYSKVGVTNETTINSIWRSGFFDLATPTIPKRIWGIDVYYTGTAGTMSIGLKNERGDIDQFFSFDLSIDPNLSSTDQYFGNSNEKIYKWLASINSTTNPTPIGRKWQFSVLEPGKTVWDVSRMDVKFSHEEQYED